VNYISEVPTAAGVPLYRLKITLRRSKPPIWRRVVVRADMRLDRLHTVIQIAMGWMNCHLHQFTAGSGFALTYYGTHDPEFGDMDSETLNEKDYTIADLAPRAGRKIGYEYDFGDGWEHQLAVEKALPPDAGFKHPVCLAGANACPPEDCGGVWGYYRLLGILADPNHPEHAEMKGWLGEEIDPAQFNLEAVNSRLKGLKA
jgi:hypothetical protein